MSEHNAPLGTARSEAPSVQQYLDRESRPVPAYLRDDAYTWLGSDDLPAERWYAREFHEREMKKMWPRVWQFACFEEEIPVAGDYVVYELGHHSFIVTRQADGSIRALYNSCLHRGTKLCAEGPGHASHFHCPFHGWEFGIDGRIEKIPCDWDFAHLDAAARQMPTARVDTWQGLVFINMDPAAMPLREYIGDIDAAFAPYPLTTKYKAAHVFKPLPCNWKIALEQFIEAYHVIATHPEGLPYLGDANAQYNIWPDRPHTSRMHSLHSVASPHVAGQYSEQDIVDIITKISDKAGAGKVRLEVPAGATARQVLAEQRRKLVQEQCGLDCSRLTDAEMVDTIHYFIFPNIVVWTAFGSPIIYRFRPHATDPTQSVMEVFFILPFDPAQPRPAPAEIIRLNAEQSWGEAAPLGKLGWVFDQDTSNAPLVQAGLLASGKQKVSLGNYQEIRIRHYHRTLDGYLER